MSEHLLTIPGAYLTGFAWVALVALALIAGVGTTALGPGGVLVLIGLFLIALYLVLRGR